MHVQGRRLADNFAGNPGNGTYWKVTSPGTKPGEGPIWMVVTPNGYPGSLRNHKVTENADGTITVEPSILVQDDRQELWHGYLKNGVWESVSAQAQAEDTQGGPTQPPPVKPQVPRGATGKVEGMHLDGQELHLTPNGVGIAQGSKFHHLTAEEAQQTQPAYVNVQGPNGSKRQLRFEQWRDRAQDASLEGWERVNDDGSAEPVGPTVAAPQRRTEGS